MARCCHQLRGGRLRHRLPGLVAAVAVLGGCLIAFSPRAFAVGTTPCDIYNPAGCTVTVGAGGATVHGWLAVVGRQVEAATSVRQGGCAPCVWLVVQECIVSSGKAGPGGEHCAGVYVDCPGIEKRFEVLYAASSAAVLAQVDSYCVGDQDGGVVDSATLATALRHYAGAVAVPPPTVRAWPPGGETLVNLPTYFASAGGQSRQQTFGGDGYTVTLLVLAQNYGWTFGDGSSLVSASAGGPPPSGGVVHVYTRPGLMRAQVLVAYLARYTVLTPEGVIGPQLVAGSPVHTRGGLLSLTVSQAFADLVS